MYLSYLTDKQVTSVLYNKFSAQNCNAIKEIKTNLYYKLPYIESFSNNTNKKIKELYKKFCRNSNINIVFQYKYCFSPFKLANWIRVKTVYQMISNCSFYTSLFVRDVNSVILLKLNIIYLVWINKHLVTDKNPYIFKHLLENPLYKNFYDENCFAIIDSTSSSFRLKLKESLHIMYLMPNLNKQKKHVSITISV